jgi:[acyl-carrier-protein] S-malonyltransferase
VLWVSCVNTLVNSGIKSIVECGPGKVLTGLIKRIDPSLSTATTEDPDHLDNALQLSMASGKQQ